MWSSIFRQSTIILKLPGCSTHWRSSMLMQPSASLKIRSPTRVAAMNAATSSGFTSNFAISTIIELSLVHLGSGFRATGSGVHRAHLAQHCLERTRSEDGIAAVQIAAEEDVRADIKNSEIGPPVRRLPPPVRYRNDV